MECQIIARMETDLPEKFGVPRQSGLIPGLTGRIVFEPAFRNPDAVRGLEGWSHLWLIWEFSQSAGKGWSPTVRPPRLGGNTRMGVFATRSPFRPNPIGLSCVTLEGVELDPQLGPVLRVGGVDLMSGTPILDIKPYLPYADCHPQATAGFTRELDAPPLQVRWETQPDLPDEKRQVLEAVLASDPRPRYQDDPQRLYGMEYAGKNVRFRVEDGTVIVVSME